MAEFDPVIRGYKYIFDVRTSRRVEGGFKSVTGISEEIEVVDLRDGTDPFQVKKIKGTHQGGQLSLERGVVKNRTEFLKWWRAVKRGEVPYWSNIVIHLNEKGTDPRTAESVTSIRFFNGWPNRYEITDLDATTSDLAMETLSVVHEGLEYLGSL